jgi:hypothetical protein
MPPGAPPIALTASHADAPLSWMAESTTIGSPIVLKGYAYPCEDVSLNGVAIFHYDAHAMHIVNNGSGLCLSTLNTTAELVRP